MTLRRPRRSPTRPAIGCSAAIAMRYEVMIQLVSATSTRRSRATCGKATTIIVEFSGTSRLPRATEIASHRVVTAPMLGREPIAKPLRGERVRAGVVMSEVRVHVLPRLEHRKKARRPQVDVVVGVSLPLAQARVRERRRRPEGFDRRGRLLSLGVDDRDARGSEELEDVVDVPRRIAHL